MKYSFTLLLIVSLFSQCGCHTHTEVDLGNYDGIAIIVGNSNVPSSLYLLFAVSKREFEEYKNNQRKVYIGKKAAINIHLNQKLVNSKLNDYYSTISLIRSECGVALSDTDLRYAFIQIKLKNFDVYSGNKRITQNVILNDCAAYLLVPTDSSSIQIEPISQ